MSRRKHRASEFIVILYATRNQNVMIRFFFLTVCLFRFCLSVLFFVSLFSPVYVSILIKVFALICLFLYSFDDCLCFNLPIFSHFVNIWGIHTFNFLPCKMACFFRVTIENNHSQENKHVQELLSIVNPFRLTLFVESHSRVSTCNCL